jgi:hypothetical protein
MDGTIVEVRREEIRVKNGIGEYGVNYEDCMVWLRPLSDMTEDELNEIKSRFVFTANCRDENDVMDIYNRGRIEFCDLDEFTDWLDKKHFDYRGLIIKGIALNLQKPFQLQNVSIIE